MPSYYHLAHVFAGGLLAIGVLHFVQGVCGNKFPTPFATPPVVGESSAVINVLWGWFNLMIGCVLLIIFFPPLPPPPDTFIAIAVGALVAGLWLAQHFSKVRHAS
jgi:hypothetical protein